LKKLKNLILIILTDHKILNLINNNRKNKRICLAELQQIKWLLVHRKKAQKEGHNLKTSKRDSKN